MSINKEKEKHGRRRTLPSMAGMLWDMTLTKPSCTDNTVDTSAHPVSTSSGPTGACSNGTRPDFSRLQTTMLITIIILCLVDDMRQNGSHKHPVNDQIVISFFPVGTCLNTRCYNYISREQIASLVGTHRLWMFERSRST